MSKPLSSMSDYERRVAIDRRLAGQSRGNGYWAAFDAKRKYISPTVKAVPAKLDEEKKR